MPIYLEIADTLRRRISKTTAGSPLPSETELAQQFGVSRMTARQAVKSLEIEGLLYQVPGSGTFTTGREAHRAINDLRSFSSEMGEKGFKARSDVVVAEWFTPDAETQADLALSPGSPAIRIVRIRYASDTPMAVESVTLTPRCAFVLDHDLSRNSLFGLLEEHGIIPTEAFGTLVAVPADAQDAQRLHVEPGAPLLVERRRINDQFGVRVESTETRYAGNQYVFDIHLVRPNPAIAQSIRKSKPGRSSVNKPAAN